MEKRLIKSRSGHIITLDDTQGQEKISIVDKTGKDTFEIDSATGSILIETKDGHKVKLDGPSGIEVVDKTGKNSVKIDSNSR